MSTTDTANTRLLEERGPDWLRMMVRIRRFEETLRDLYKKLQKQNLLVTSASESKT